MPSEYEANITLSSRRMLNFPKIFNPKDLCQKFVLLSSKQIEFFIYTEYWAKLALFASAITLFSCSQIFHLELSLEVLFVSVPKIWLFNFKRRLGLRNLQNFSHKTKKYLEAKYRSNASLSRYSRFKQILSNKLSIKVVQVKKFALLSSK